MTQKNTGPAAGLIAVVVTCALAGFATAALLHGCQSTQEATTRPTTQPAATAPATQPTTRPALMEAAENITVIGKAICGTCFLDMGPHSEHFVVLETKDPYRTFLLAENDQLDEIEAITGSCANGDYELTVTGDVLTVNDQNVLVVHSFTHHLREEDGG